MPLAVADGVAPGARLEDAVTTAGRRGRSVHSVEGVSLNVEPARLTAVVGPAGSGKSSVLACLAGARELSSGHAFIGEVDLGALRSRPRRRLRDTRIARLSGSSTSEADWFAAVLGSTVRPDDGHQWGAAMRDLACSPKLVLADDVVATSALPAFLRRLVDAFGQTVVMATRDPAAAARADHAVRLAAGRVVGRSGGVPT